MAAPCVFFMSKLSELMAPVARMVKRQIVGDRFTWNGVEYFGVFTSEQVNNQMVAHGYEEIMTSNLRADKEQFITTGRPSAREKITYNGTVYRVFDVTETPISYTFQLTRE